MRVYIHYCGGCNPRYDRTELAEKLRSELSGHTFSYESAGADAELTVCGCATACAVNTPSAAPRRIVVTRAVDASAVAAALADGAEEIRI